MSSVDIQRRLLEVIERDPNTTQAGMAAQLGVAVGSVNWYLKRLVRKGYVKVTQLQRRKLKYFVTPRGLALKAHLTSQYMEASLRLYRELREAAREVLDVLEEAGYTEVCLVGEDEAAEIFRLTCLERGVQVILEEVDGAPQVFMEGLEFIISWPDESTAVDLG